MNESIIVGLVVGVGVAAVGAVVGHCIRLREMREQWDEDERRRKSERSRELLERELAIITEFTDVNMDLWLGIIWWSDTDKLLTADARAELGNKAFLMHAKANVAALSLADETMEAGVEKLIELTRLCSTLLDSDTAKPHAGKDEEYRQALLEMRLTAADIRRRARELLEEV
jgi:hypothetical protein